MLPNKTSQKNGIPVVLGGGAMRGVSHLGLLDFLEDRKVICEGFTGVSIGSLVSAFYTNGYSTKEIRKLFVRELMRPKLGLMIVSLLPPIFDPLLRLAGGIIDLVPLMRELVEKYHLKTQDNLRIIAYDCYSLSPVVFEGHGYDLAVALAASCAVPGVMRPVSYDNGRRRLVMVDGGVYHPQPGLFCHKPCIVGKLINSSVVNLVYPDRGEDFVANVGDPSCGFFARMSDRRAAELHLFGYRRASADLLPAIMRGNIPVAE